jgi:glyoxylase-like metal-dependent hydrolase (beta-lactamase superfamily II)
VGAKIMSIFPRIAGQITDYDIIVVGHLRWNRYFGESAANPPRGLPMTCTSTLIRGMDREGRPFVLIVDPTMRETASDYYFDLNRRTGLHAADVTHCYVTHDHLDHEAGLNYFPRAIWLAATPVAEALHSSEHIPGAHVTAVEGEFLPGLYALSLPGHTTSLHGLAFIYRGKKIVIAGDAVMTRNHLWHNTCEFAQDDALAAQTILTLKENADMIIPGHDNLVVVR